MPLRQPSASSFTTFAVTSPTFFHACFSLPEARLVNSKERFCISSAYSPPSAAKLISSIKMRQDLAEKLEALNPTFLRFPGGCVIEGVTLDAAYDWKALAITSVPDNSST